MSEINRCAKAILNLIEDKQYPAKRVIFNYVTQIIAEYDPEKAKEIDLMAIKYFQDIP